MNRLKLQDAFFVRMKLEKSIRLPKSSNQISHQTVKNSPNFTKSSTYMVNSMTSNTNYELPQNNQIDTWILKKQIKLRELISHRTRIDRHFQPSDPNYDKISLKTKEKWKENSISKQQSINKSNFIQDGQSSNSKFSASKRNFNTNNTTPSQKENKRLSRTPDSVPYLNKAKKQTQQINYPVLLKSKQIRSTIQKQQVVKSNKKKQATKNHQLHKKNHTTESSGDFKLFNRAKTLTHNHSTSLYLVNQTSKFVKQYLQRNSQSRSDTIQEQKNAKSPFKNQIYQDRVKGNRLIKKYSHRQMSPQQKRDLRNKYSRLEKRLDNILLRVRTDKQN